jgi:hypothetical protein
MYNFDPGINRRKGKLNSSNANACMAKQVQAESQALLGSEMEPEHVNRRELTVRSYEAGVTTYTLSYPLRRERVCPFPLRRFDVRNCVHDSIEIYGKILRP